MQMLDRTGELVFFVKRLISKVRLLKCINLSLSHLARDQPEVTKRFVR